MKFLSLAALPHIRLARLDDAPALAALHANRFRHAWDQTDFETLLAQESTCGLLYQNRPDGTPDGFILIRLVAGEAEILTFAVHKKTAGKGMGRALLAASLSVLQENGTETLFLEVDADNGAACHLYSQAGFARVGERKGYYDQGAGKRASALIMRRDFGM